MSTLRATTTTGRNDAAPWSGARVARSAVLACDRGLMRHAGDSHWQEVVAHMASAFRERRYEDGLTQALEETSAVLVANFARTDASPDPLNELPDTPLLQ